MKYLFIKLTDAEINTLDVFEARDEVRRLNAEVERLADKIGSLEFDIQDLRR